MEKKSSFTSEIGRILRDSRDIEVNDIDNRLQLAVALAVKLHTTKNTDERANIGRMLGPSFAQDHRRMRFGRKNLIRSRSSRSTWR